MRLESLRLIEEKHIPSEVVGEVEGPLFSEASEIPLVDEAALTPLHPPENSFPVDLAKETRIAHLYHTQPIKACGTRFAQVSSNQCAL